MASAPGNWQLIKVTPDSAFLRQAIHRAYGNTRSVRSISILLLSSLFVLAGISGHAQYSGEPVTVQWPKIGGFLSWNPTNDPDARYNSVPLASRISNPALNINSHAQTNEAKIMALVSFNSYSVGSAEGPHTTSYYPFNYWGYLESRTFWGSSNDDRGILMSTADHVVDAAHGPMSIVVADAQNQFSLSWPGDHTGWRLQAQTKGLGTNWFDAPNSFARNQIIIPLPAAACFFV